MKKTWFEKMQDKPGYPKTLILEEGFPCYAAMHKMGADVGDPIVIVNASEILPLTAAVPEGKVTTLWEICAHIAQVHKVKGCCTLVTGIHTMTIANAVAEQSGKGEDGTLSQVPYWRTLKVDGFLNDKYPGGQEAHKARLEAEGIEVGVRGKKYQVMGLEKHLFGVN